MMKRILICIVFLFALTQVWSQNNRKTTDDHSYRIPLIGEKAPSFTAETTNGTLNFPQDFGKSWKILFSHPQDYTPVCSSEILELAYLQSEFEKQNVKLAIISVDPVITHKNWKEALEKFNYKDRERVEIKFPLIADESLVVSKKYGMVHPITNTTKTVRGVFIIDPENNIQSIQFNPMSVGRNMNEILRLITALQATKAEQVMTPANWNSGDDLLIPSLPYTEEIDPNLTAEGIYRHSWFMWFKKAN